MSSTFRLIQQSCTAATPPIVLLTTAAVSVTTVSLFYVKNASKTHLEQDDTSRQEHYKMDVNLMDKIAEKPYLPVTKQRSVPKRLRLLAIDVPDMRTNGIDGECRVNTNKIFTDGVAPPKTIAGTDIQVLQKSFAHALVKCRNKESLRIGVEMTEASVADLNPHNLRRTYQFGSYRYDPGKWSKTSNTAKTTASTQEATDEVEVDIEATSRGETEAADSVVEERPEKRTNVKKDAPDGGTVLATEEDEYDAPWNQYAWIQELQLRVSE